MKWISVNEISVLFFSICLCVLICSRWSWRHTENGKGKGLTPTPLKTNQSKAKNSVSYRAHKITIRWRLINIHKTIFDFVAIYGMQLSLSTIKYSAHHLIYSVPIYASRMSHIFNRIWFYFLPKFVFVESIKSVFPFVGNRIIFFFSNLIFFVAFVCSAVYSKS